MSVHNEVIDLMNQRQTWIEAHEALARMYSETHREKEAARIVASEALTVLEETLDKVSQYERARLRGRLAGLRYRLGDPTAAERARREAANDVERGTRRLSAQIAALRQAAHIAVDRACAEMAEGDLTAARATLIALDEQAGPRERLGLGEAALQAMDSMPRARSSWWRRALSRMLGGWR